MGQDEALALLQQAMTQEAEGRLAAVAALADEALLRLARLLMQNGADPALTVGDAPGPEVAEWAHYRGLLEAARGRLANGERLCLRAHQVCRELRDDRTLAEVCNSLTSGSWG